MALYEVTTARLNENKQLQNHIGTAIAYERRGLIAINMEEAHVNQRANVEFKVTGATGQAVVRAKLRYENGKWKVTHFEAECDDGTFVEHPEAGVM